MYEKGLQDTLHFQQAQMEGVVPVLTENRYNPSSSENFSLMQCTYLQYMYIDIALSNNSFRQQRKVWVRYSTGFLLTESLQSFQEVPEDFTGFLFANPIKFLTGT